MSTQLTAQHRASEPLTPVERPDVIGTHRGGRTSDLPIAAALGIILLVVAAILAVNH